MTRIRFAALALGLLAPLLALGQVTTDYTKTGIPNGTPSAITATTGTGATMVLQSSPTLNTPTLSVPKFSTQTWANLPAAASATWAVTVASDLGTNGTLVASNGARWRPVNGEANLKQVAAAQTGIANTETIVLQTLIPAGAWQTNDTIRVWVSITKSGTTDSGSIAVRAGTAGTTSDTALVSNTFLVAASQSGGFILEFKLASATSVQMAGTQGGSSAYAGGISTAASAPVTITDASANALYISVGIKSNAATNTVGIQSGQIQLITP